MLASVENGREGKLTNFSQYFLEHVIINLRPLIFNDFLDSYLPQKAESTLKAARGKRYKKPNKIRINI